MCWGLVVKREENTRDSPEWHLVKDWVLIMNELCNVNGEGFLSLIVEVG
jgi:hypothetical protein